MTEQEWLRSWDIRAMVAALRGKGTERLWQLFAVACAERRADSMRDPRSVQALEVARRFADGAATRGELIAARGHAEAAERQASQEAWEEEARSNFNWTKQYAAAWEERCAADVARQCVAEDFGTDPSEESLTRAESWLAADLLREIFGNPFRGQSFTMAGFLTTSMQQLSLAAADLRRLRLRPSPYPRRRPGRSRLHRRRHPRPLPRPRPARPRLLGTRPSARPDLSTGPGFRWSVP